MVVPTVYQGMYNCVTRACEPELVPALRKLNMSFLAGSNLWAPSLLFFCFHLPLNASHGT